jgi:activator of 2-hydroxyglutaryl-CoA dehydratase
MGYFLGVDIGSVNAKLSLIDEESRVVERDTEKVTSSPRAAATPPVTQLGERSNLQQIVATPSEFKIPPPQSPTS